jgi:aldose 1-epimerase
LFDKFSGRFMEVFTNQPGLQFYSGNSLDEKIKGKGRIMFKSRTGLCLETQNFPDSPNNPNFPFAVLNPGEIYNHQTIYKFSIKK